MSDQYLPDNAPRDILLSLQELSQKNIAHAATFKLAAARIAELEAALRRVDEMCNPKPGIMSFLKIQNIVREALEGIDEN